MTAHQWILFVTFCVVVGFVSGYTQSWFQRHHRSNDEWDEQW